MRKGRLQEDWAKTRKQWSWFNIELEVLSDILEEMSSELMSKYAGLSFREEA